VLLAQGLARGTQRVTGYPYRSPEGLSPAGLRLDRYLRPLGFTIDHLDAGRTYIYSTDLVPWYPGKHPRGKGDLRPTADEVALCWPWFERELALVQPRAVVQLGKWTADRFLRRYGDELLGGRALLEVAGYSFAAAVAGRRVTALAAYHPSAIWGKFEEPGDESWRRASEVLSQLLGTG
jgi:uracil-DNA glycosylase family 4